MDFALLFRYIIALFAVFAVVYGLSRLKKALLRLLPKWQKTPPSNS